MPSAPRPFDDIRALLGKMPKADEAARSAAPFPGPDHLTLPGIGASIE
jgi:hypothetical protein